MMINTIDIDWTDEDLHLIREAFETKIKELSKHLHDSRTNTQEKELVVHKYNKYIEFYRLFGGKDPIG